MSEYTFVTKSGVFNDDTCTVNIPSDYDIRVIINDATTPLKTQNNELKNEIRELKENNRKLQQTLNQVITFLVGNSESNGLELMTAITKNGGTVYECMGKTIDHENVLQQLPEDCRKMFKETIKEVLEPHYQALAAETQKLIAQKTQIDSIAKAEQRLEIRQNETQASCDKVQSRTLDMLNKLKSSLQSFLNNL